MWATQTPHLNSRVAVPEPEWTDQRGRHYTRLRDIGDAHLLNIIQYLRRLRVRVIAQGDYAGNQKLFMKERMLIEEAKARNVWLPIHEV